MNLPNKLTMLRIIFVPFVLLFLVPPAFMPLGFHTFVAAWPGRLIALILFIAASLTDLFDGRIARARNITTTFGKFLDPIADKMLVIAVLIAFAELSRISTFVVVLVLARELAISGIRMLAAEKGVVIAAILVAKWKTVSQMTALIWLLAEPILNALFAAPLLIQRIGDGLVAVSLIMAVWSLIVYLQKAGKFISVS